MKKALITALSITMVCSFGYSQGITLKEGDNYYFKFSTLSLQGVYSAPPPPGVPAGRFDALFAPGSFVPGAVVRFDMFENSTDTQAIASQTLVSYSGFPAPPGPVFWAVGAWQDLEGSVSFTMLSGSATIAQFRVAADREESAGLTAYSITTVPEPGAFALMVSFIGIAAIWRTKA